MANKFILTIALMFAVLVFTATALAAECSRSGDTMLITYSPNDLNVGEEFNLTYYDLFGGANQNVTLNYPALLTNLGNDNATLNDDGFGGGYFTWRMNSSAPGNHTVYVSIDYEEGGCNITRTIVILPTLEAPNLVVSYNGTGNNIIANQNTLLSLIINNTGVGTAYNVSGWTSLIDVIDTFSYSEISAGNTITRDFTVNTGVCGVSTLESTANYQDSFGYNYLPSHANTLVNVVGSDLEITDFDVSDTSIKKGKSLKFEVTVRNKDRSTTINATDVVVKIYRDGDLIETIDLGDIEVGESETGEGSWKVRGSTGTVEIEAVVDSDNECSNWNNNEESIEIRINREDDEDEEWIWPLPEEDEEEPEEIISEISEVEPEEDFGAIAIIAIALEVVILALVAVYLAKRKRQPKSKRIKQKQPNLK